MELDPDALPRPLVYRGPMFSPFILDPRLASDTIAVGDLALSSVLLLNDSRFPWFVLVPGRPGLSEITDLSE